MCTRDQQLLCKIKKIIDEACPNCKPNDPCPACMTFICYDRAGAGVFPTEPIQGYGGDRGNGKGDGERGKKGSDGHPLKKSKSRELRGSVLYTGCRCIKRDGLQDDCPRSECQNRPECLAKPNPVCGPGLMARARIHYLYSLVDKVYQSERSRDGKVLQGGTAGPGIGMGVSSLRGSGQGFAHIGGVPVTFGDPNAMAVKIAGVGPKNAKILVCQPMMNCVSAMPMPCIPCESPSKVCSQPVVIIGVPCPDDDSKADGVAKKVEPCRRPGCLHSKPLPPCKYDFPCPASCFHHPPGMKPSGRYDGGPVWQGWGPWPPDDGTFKPNKKNFNYKYQY